MRLTSSLKVSVLSAVFFATAVMYIPASPGDSPKETSLVLGMMPALNSLPLIVAEYNGYFEDEGVTVDLVMFKSQFYRESALQARTIDGTVSDLINAVMSEINGFPIAVTSFTDGVFALMTSPDSKLGTISDWNSRPAGSVKTGLLKSSVVFYTTERMLQEAGGNTRAIDLISTLHIPARMEMVLAGGLEAGCFPEPLATAAEMQGARRLLDTRILKNTPGVLLFTEKTLSEKPEAVRGLYRAYNRAVTDLNRGIEPYKEIIIERGEFPPPVMDALSIPRFQQAAVPTAREYADVVGWMIEKDLITGPPDYGSVVDGSFLP